MEKRFFINELKVGEYVEDVFYLIAREFRKKRNGEKFIVFHFKDKTGIIDGLLWDNIEQAARINKGTFVKIRGIVNQYKDRINIILDKIDSFDEALVNKDDFLPVSKKDIEEMFIELQDIITSIKHSDIKNLLKNIFSDKNISERFKRAPAGIIAHHAYIGGLLEHTLSMARIGTAIKSYDINKDLLLAGIILHDIGKIYEYTYDKTIDFDSRGKLLGHIVIGYEIVKKAINGFDAFPSRLADMLLHMILSHHGELEFGSPVKPLFKEAEILYHIDNLDAKMQMFETAEKDTKENANLWSDYHSFLQRKVLISTRYEELDIP